MLAKISGTEKKSNWYYGELMAVGLMALSSLWVRKVPGSTPGDARFVVEYDANIVFDLYIIKWKKSTCYTDVWYPFLNFLRNAGLLLINYCMWNFILCVPRAHLYSLRIYFLISFLVSVGSIEHHSCESQQIIERQKFSKWCRRSVIPTSLFIWSLHEHRRNNPDLVATGKRVF